MIINCNVGLRALIYKLIYSIAEIAMVLVTDAVDYFILKRKTSLTKCYIITLP